MVLPDFEDVVKACCKRRFNVRHLVERLQWMDYGAFGTRPVFGGSDGCLQEIGQLASDNEATSRFCDIWIQRRDNESIINVVMAAKQYNSDGFVSFILEKVEKVVTSPGGDEDAKQRMSKRLRDLGLSSKPDQTPEFRLKTAGVPIFSYYHPWPTLEGQIIEKLKIIAKEPEKGALVLWGLGGIGKTSSMAHILGDRTYQQQLAACDLHSAIWINCFRWQDSSSFKETEFLTEVSSVARKLTPIPGDSCDLETIITSFGRHCPLFVLDDMFNIKLLEFFRHSCPAALCCVLTRDVTAIAATSFTDIQLRQSEIRVEDWSDDEVNDALTGTYRLLDKGLSSEQLAELCDRCFQSPLIVNMIGAYFPDTQSSPGLLNSKYNQLLNKLGNITEQTLERNQHRTVRQLFQFSIERLSPEDENPYYAFLLFDPAEPVQVTDLAILWCFSEEKDVLAKLYNTYLMSSLVREEKDSSGGAMFSIHQLLHDAGVDFATRCRKVASDIDELRFRLVTGYDGKTHLDVSLNILSKNKRSLLRRIIRSLRGKYLAELCRLREERTGGLTFLHYLYNHRWPDDVKAGRLLAEKKHSCSLVLQILQKIQNECVLSACQLITELIADSANLPGLFSQIEAVGIWEDSYKKLLRAFLTPWKQKQQQEKWRTDMLAEYTGNNVIIAALNKQTIELGNEEIASMKHNEIETLVQIAGKLGTLTVFAKLLPLMRGELKKTIGKEVSNSVDIATENGHLEVIKFLYENFPNDAVKIPSSSQSTRLSLAAANGHLEVVKFLFDNFPDAVKVPDKSQRTPLFWAAENGHLGVVECLYDKFPEAVKMPDRIQRSPLSRAAENGHLEVVKFLFDKFPEAVKMPDSSQRTPLFWAAENGHLEVVKFLFDEFPEAVKMPDRIQRTPLSLAAANGHLEVVKFLFDKFPDAVKMPDRSQQTPLSWAAENGHLEVVNFFNAVASGL